MTGGIVKFLRIIGLTSLVLGTLGCAQSKAMTPNHASEFASNCDVINEDFCFALAQGDIATLSMPVDFKLYEVVLANEQKVIVYYGSQPNYPENSEPLFSAEFGAEKVILYRRSVDDMKRVDAFYEKQREAFTVVVHVSSTYPSTDEASFLAFLVGLRKCDSARKGLIECAPDQLFAKAAEKL